MEIIHFFRFIPQFFFPDPFNYPVTPMPKVHKRKYEKIDEAEINLVVQCIDSHEFYERYREEFPTRKKGIDSISKIWKRRGEFIKKQQGTEQPDSDGSGSTRELELLIAAQNKIFAELTSLMQEQLKVSRETLALFQRPSQKTEDHSHKPAAAKTPDQKEPAKKTGHDKPPADIMIGS
jgi:hypothetical protein